MPTTPNMNLNLPTEGADAGEWDDKLNDALDLVDAHDHSTGKGVKIKTAALQIDDDLVLSGFSVEQLRSAEFDLVSTAAMAGRVRGLFFNEADNEFYIRTNSGTNVKVTNAGALDISGVGGIGGDYAAVGAEVSYADSTDAYSFKQQIGTAVRQWARLLTGGVDLYEKKAHPSAGVPTNRVRLSSPAALAASYELVFGAALPLSKKLIQVDAAGAVTYDNSVGAMTLTGGATLSSGQTLDASAGNLLVPAWTTPIDISAGRSSSAAYDGTKWTLEAFGIVDIPLLVPIGHRITSCLSVIKQGAGTTKTELFFRSNDIPLGAGGTTSIGSDSSASGSDYLLQTVSGLPYTVTAAAHGLFVRVTGNASHLISLQVTTDRVA